MATLEGVTALLREARVKVFEAGHALVATMSSPPGAGQYPDWEKPREELQKLDRLVEGRGDRLED